MLSIHEHQTLEEAGGDLLDFILTPENWVGLEKLGAQQGLRPGQNPAYQRRVGGVRICASVDVSSSLEVFLRVAFRAPNLTPSKGADLLEDFLRARVPLTPNSEWHVQVDTKGWIHFIRRWTGEALQA